MVSETRYLAFCLLYCIFSFGRPVVPASISKDVNDLKYYYFPSSDQKVEITFRNAKSLNESNLQAATKTVVIIDGFLSDSTSPMSTRMKDDYVSLGDQNVILLDWGRLSGAGMTFSNPLQTAAAYLIVLGNVEPIGKRVAEFLDFLRENKQIQFSDVSIVGHSLGAHRTAGAAVRNNYNQVVNRITGQDPAGPFFSLQLSKDKRIHSGQATFVDIYHTNRGTLGDSTNDAGDVNIYVNGGSSQPGCEEADRSGFPGYCSHSYSWKLFSAAFDNSIKACPCSSISACTCKSCEHQCEDGFVIGPNIDSSIRGRFYVTTGPLE